MTLSRSIIVLTIGFCFVGLGVGENPAKHFHWDVSTIERHWDSIKQSKDLSARERAALIEAVAVQLRPSMSDLKIDSEQQLREFAARTQIKVVELATNGHREVLAQATDPFLCSPTGNCKAWIFRQEGDTYSVILSRGAVQTFTIQPTITKGFHDIVLGQHGSATEQGLTLFRFDGLAYRLAARYEARWEILGTDGELHKFEEPQITPSEGRKK
jgi:hypothetical protein